MPPRELDLEVEREVAVGRVALPQPHHLAHGRAREVDDEVVAGAERIIIDDRILVREPGDARHQPALDAGAALRAVLDGLVLALERLPELYPAVAGVGDERLERVRREGQASPGVAGPQ